MKKIKVILAAFLATFASLSAKETLEQRVAKLEILSAEHQKVLEELKNAPSGSENASVQKLSPAESEEIDKKREERLKKKDSNASVDGVADMFTAEEKRAEDEKRAADKKQAEEEKTFERANKKKKQDVFVESADMFNDFDKKYAKSEDDRKKREERLKKKDSNTSVEGVADMFNDSETRYNKTEEKRKQIEKLQQEMIDLKTGNDGYIKADDSKNANDSKDSKDSKKKKKKNKKSDDAKVDKPAADAAPADASK